MHVFVLYVIDVRCTLLPPLRVGKTGNTQKSLGLKFYYLKRTVVLRACQGQLAWVVSVLLEHFHELVNSEQQRDGS
jgi:hypothetical protein